MDCPNFERCEGEIRFTVVGDSQGVAPWTMSFDYLELEEQTCNCEFTAEQWDEIEKQYWEGGYAEPTEPDFYD